MIHFAARHPASCHEKLLADKLARNSVGREPQCHYADDETGKSIGESPYVEIVAFLFHAVADSDHGFRQRIDRHGPYLALAGLAFSVDRTCATKGDG